MDETAILTNIATILAKDMLLDRQPKIRNAPYTLQQFHNLFEDSDDDLEQFVYEIQTKKLKKFDAKRSPRAKNSEETSDGEFEDESNSTAENANSQQPQAMPQPEINLRIAQFLLPKDFEANFHMRKSSFNALLEVLGPLIKLSVREIKGMVVSKDTFLALALWKLTTNQHFEEIAHRFKISLSICYWSMHNFCDLISSFLKTFITWPSMHQLTTLKNLKTSQLLGVISAKRFEVFLESQDEEIGVILQLICTSDLIITDCYLDLAMTYSCYDSPILKRLQSENNFIPEGYYLIGDNTFPLKSFLITPYNDANNDHKVRFNQFLNEQLKTSEQTLNQMVQRFQSLYSLEAKNLNEMKKITETICGLHNFCRRFNDNCSAHLAEVKVVERRRQARCDETDVEGVRRRDELLQLICP